MPSGRRPGAGPDGRPLHSHRAPGARSGGLRHERRASRSVRPVGRERGRASSLSTITPARSAAEGRARSHAPAVVTRTRSAAVTRLGHRTATPKAPHMVGGLPQADTRSASNASGRHERTDSHDHPNRRDSESEREGAASTARRDLGEPLGGACGASLDRRPAQGARSARWAEHRRDPAAAKPWSEVRASLERRRK